MSMSNQTRRDVSKMRELLWHYLEGQKCFFCKKPLVPKTRIRFGNACAPGLDLDLTIHHKNENHNDNRKVNRGIAHESCHKSHHAKKVFRQWRAA